MCTQEHVWLVFLLYTALNNTRQCLWLVLTCKCTVASGLTAFNFQVHQIHLRVPWQVTCTCTCISTFWLSLTVEVTERFLWQICFQRDAYMYMYMYTFFKSKCIFDKQSAKISAQCRVQVMRNAWKIIHNFERKQRGILIYFLWNGSTFSERIIFHDNYWYHYRPNIKLVFPIMIWWLIQVITNVCLFPFNILHLIVGTTGFDPFWKSMGLADY